MSIQMSWYSIAVIYGKMAAWSGNVVLCNEMCSKIRDNVICVRRVGVPRDVDVRVTQDKPSRSKYRELQRRLSSASVVLNYCVRFYYAFIVNSIVWHRFIVNIDPFQINRHLDIWRISIIYFTGGVEFLLSNTCCANFHFPFSYLKSWF